jgi:dTDP-4-amino-4,6-dideoxygalactose transaminase
MDKITSYCNKNPVILIEDCSQAFGSSYSNIMVGNYADFSVYSLIKTHYTIAGGILATNDDLNIGYSGEVNFAETTYKQLKRYLESKMSIKKNVFDILHFYLMKLSKGAASVSKNTMNKQLNKRILFSVFEQIKKFDEIQEKRSENASYLLKSITNYSDLLLNQKTNKNAINNFMRLFFTLNTEVKQVIELLRKKNIMANMITQDSYSFVNEPVNKCDCFNKYYNRSLLPVYNKVFHRIISIPISPALSRIELDYIVNNIAELNLTIY